MDTFGLGIYEILILISPLIILELILKIICIIKISKEGVGNLSKLLWLLIVIFVGTFGPVAFLLFGRKKYNYDAAG